MSIGTRGNKRPLAASDFEAQLVQQMGWLERSCRDFDSGHHDEAIRIATTIRVLVYDGPNSTSLLTHLGIKHALRFVDTGVYRQPFNAAILASVRSIDPTASICESASDVGLVELGQVQGGLVGWYAPLVLNRWKSGSPPHTATKGLSSFDEWWDTALVESSSRKSFSRAHLVKIMANQAGGAHVDRGLDADFADLCIDPLGIQIMVGDSPLDMRTEDPFVKNNVAYASVRQIAFELLLTLQRRQALRKPGASGLANPYEGIALPTRPHQRLNFPHVTVYGSALDAVSQESE